jgi:hypothetical protein
MTESHWNEHEHVNPDDFMAAVSARPPLQLRIELPTKPTQRSLPVRIRAYPRCDGSARQAGGPTLEGRKVRKQETGPRLGSGSVVCWGINDVGQVGPNSAAFNVDPPGVLVPGVNALDIAAGIDYTCAIPSANPRTLTCWGHASASARVIAPDLAPGLQIVKIGSGQKAYSTCGILSDGALLCWDAFGTPQAVPATW